MVVALVLIILCYVNCISAAFVGKSGDNKEHHEMAQGNEQGNHLQGNLKGDEMRRA